MPPTASHPGYAANSEKCVLNRKAQRKPNGVIPSQKSIGQEKQVLGRSISKIHRARGDPRPIECFLSTMTLWYSGLCPKEITQNERSIAKCGIILTFLTYVVDEEYAIAIR